MVGVEHSPNFSLLKVVVLVVLSKATALSEAEFQTNIQSSHTADAGSRRPWLSRSSNIAEGVEDVSELYSHPVTTDRESIYLLEKSEDLQNWIQQAMEKTDVESLGGINAEVLELAQHIATSSNLQVEVKMEIEMEGGDTVIHENFSAVIPSQTKICWVQRLREATFLVSAMSVVGCAAALAAMARRRRRGNNPSAPLCAITSDAHQGCWHTKSRSFTGDNAPLLTPTSHTEAVL